MLAPWCLLLQLVLGAAEALALQVRLVGVEGVLLRLLLLLRIPPRPAGRWGALPGALPACGWPPAPADP